MISLALLPFLIVPAQASLVARQSASARPTTSITPTQTTSAESIWPTGLQGLSGDWESTLPLPCAPGCIAPANATCFVMKNLTSFAGTESGNESIVTDPTACNAYLCQQRNYEQLADCLNCIIANGNERPFGYHSDPSVSTTLSPLQSAIGTQYNPQGLLDVELANGWLRNVTEQCSAAGLALSGVESTVTATPTSTGPYYTTWTASETVLLTQWTGLTEYNEPTPIVLTAGASVPSAPPAQSGPIGSASGSSNGVAPSASQSGAAESNKKPGKGKWEWWLTGLVGMVVAALGGR